MTEQNEEIDPLLCGLQEKHLKYKDRKLRK